jgi:hypothetical protein
MPIPAKEIKNNNRQTIAAIPFGTFIPSNHLQSGKKSVAKIPPIARGIRKTLAKYNPAITRNRINSVFIIEDEEVVILNSLNCRATIS